MFCSMHPYHDDTKLDEIWRFADCDPAAYSFPATLVTDEHAACICQLLVFQANFLRYTAYIPFARQVVPCAGVPLSASRRQKHFWSPENRNRTYTTEHIWTFCIYQSQVNMSTYQLDVGLKFDLCRHLDGQPMQFMLRDRYASVLSAHSCWIESRVDFYFLVVIDLAHLL